MATATSDVTRSSLLRLPPDFEIAGVVRRQGDKDKPLELTPYEVVDDITKLKEVDVAFLCTPTRSCPDYAERLVALGINTVDSFDIHTSILEYRTRQMENCKKAGRVSVIAAGWDPGSDSVVRVLLEALAPKGLTYTNFGRVCRWATASWLAPRRASRTRSP